MALPTNVYETYTAVGDVEDLSNIIWNVDPFDTPVMNSLETVPAVAKLHVWQIDVLGAGANNVAVEADDPTAESLSATTELSNTTQISQYTIIVSGTQQAILKAGRGDELSYQIARHGKKLRNDMEVDITSNTAEDVSSTTNTRNLGGMGTWITTNTSNGPGGTDGSLGNTARTDGTERAFSEALLKGVLADCFTNGGNPDLIAVGAFNKQKFSGFTGNATREVMAAEEKLYASIDRLAA